ncbi:MAG: VUT family protein, partial [Candidatus Hodarchaeota archaeon]
MIESILYVFFIILADVLAARWIIPLPLGLAVPAGVFAIAPIFTLRDAIHKKYGYKRVTILIFVASIISYGISILLGNELLGKVTIASVIAFLVSENADTFVYHVFRKDTWLSRVIKSNSVSTLLDSIVFIGLSFGLVWSLILGQYIVKILIAGLTGVFLNWRYKNT